MSEKTNKKANVPNLRFPGFEGEWKTTTVGACAESLDYGMNAAAMKFDGENRYIRITDIDESSSMYKSDAPVSPNGDMSDKYLVQEGDILFARTGAGTGRTYLYNSDDGKLYFAGFLIRARIKKDYNSHFIFAQTQTLQYDKWVQLMSMRSGQPGINSQEYSRFEFKIPSKNEQDKIATLLSLVDSRIHTQNKIINQLESLIHSVCNNLFTQKLRFKNAAGKEFQNSEIKKLNEICVEHQLKNRNNEHSEVFSVAKHKGVINQIEHLGRSFSAKEITHYKLIFPGDLVYTKSPTSDFPFGIIKQNRTGRIGVVSPLYCVFKPKTYALGYLLHEYFNSSINTFNYLSPLVQKGAKNTMNINNDDFLNGAGLLICTDEYEQTAIMTFLQTIYSKIALERKMLSLYREQKQYLLTHLFI